MGQLELRVILQKKQRSLTRKRNAPGKEEVGMPRQWINIRKTNWAPFCNCKQSLKLLTRKFYVSHPVKLIPRFLDFAHFFAANIIYISVNLFNVKGRPQQCHVHDGLA